MNKTYHFLYIILRSIIPFYYVESRKPESDSIPSRCLDHKRTTLFHQTSWVARGLKRSCFRSTRDIYVLVTIGVIGLSNVGPRLNLHIRRWVKSMGCYYNDSKA